MQTRYTTTMLAVCLATSPTVNGIAAQEVETPVTAVAQDKRDDQASLSPEEAIRLATEVLDRLPPVEDRREAVAMINQVNGYLDVVRASDPANPWLTFLYGRVLAYTGRQGDAIQQLRKFVDTREGRNEWHAFRLLGDLFLGEFPQLAKSNYQKALALNSTEPALLLGLSRCSLKLGNVDEAVSLARQAVAAADRSDPRYVAHLARTLNAAEESEAALREAHTALAMAERQADEQPGRLAPLLVVDAQYQLIIDLLRARIGVASTEAVLQSPGFSAAQFTEDHRVLAVHLRRRAKFAQRIADHDVVRMLESAVNATAPDTSHPLLEQYGESLVRVGRSQAALEVFRQLLAADSENTTARAWLERLESENTENTPTLDP